MAKRRHDHSNAQRHVQQNAAAAAGDPTHGASAAGAPNAACDLPAGPIRRNRGWFRKGEAGPRLQHGLYSDGHEGGPELLAEVERLKAEAVIDEGVADVGEIPARRRTLIEYRFSILHKNIRKIALALDERGPVDKRGKLRVAWLSKAESLINTAIRIDGLLGLDRRPKQIEETVDQWLDRVAQEREQQQQHDEGEADGTSSGNIDRETE